MSISQHHNEWLSLIEISGPFLSLPVLNRTFPQGLETVQPALRQDLRAAYEEWRDNQGGVRADPAIHRAWIEWVLTDLLTMDDEVLIRNQSARVNKKMETPTDHFAVTVPEHGETLRPDFTVVNPSLAHHPGGIEKGTENKVGRLLVMIVPPGQDLDKPLKGQRWAASPATRMMLLLHGTGVRLGLVTNGEQWMIVDAPQGETTGFISWYAELWLDEPLTLQAFVTLFNAGRFFGVAADKTIEALLAASAADQQEVTDQLGYQVRRAVELLVQSIDLADRDSHGNLLANVSASELYEAAVVVMMRLVFLLTAEERDLLLLGDALYDEHYALSTLQAQLRALADQHGEEILALRDDAWQRLLALFRGVHQGIYHDRLQLPAYGGDLFDPNRYPFLEGRVQAFSQVAGSKRTSEALRISNRTVLHLLEALQFLQIKIGNERQARRLSFRALDVEQIGMVYEGLLDHTVKRATSPVVGLVGTREKEPEIALAQLEAFGTRAELLKFLQEETGRSASALQKAIEAAQPDLYTAEQLRIACDNDDALYQRVRSWHGLIRNDDYGRRVVIPAGRRYMTSGAARRASGAHYTPRSLGEPLVQHTLEPLVYIGPAEGRPRDQWRLRSPAVLLNLKICDMAMGSGALLVQACRYLADRLLEAVDTVVDGPLGAHKDRLAQTDGAKPNAATWQPLLQGMADPAERLIFARRLIAQRCLYGVDKNPLAVEMAKLSLWLITMDRGKPFTFVDHALRCGDSLIGVDLAQLKCWNLAGTGNRQFGTLSLDLDIQQMIALRREIEAMPVLDVQDEATKRHKLAQAQAIANNLISSADDLVATYYNMLGQAEQATLRAALLTARQQNASIEPKWRGLANLDGLKPFHWQLEFPEVFLGEGRSGFDGFVGNPPFTGGRRIRESLGDRYRIYLDSAYVGAKGNADLSAFFFLRGFNHLQQKGTLGLIATNTIAQGDTRLTGLAKIEEMGGTIYRAINNMSWPGQAAVVVNIIHLAKAKMQPPFMLDGSNEEYISSQLDNRKVAGEPYTLQANSGRSFQGSLTRGMGFVITYEESEELISQDQQNSEVVQPYLNGQDLNSSPSQSPSRWVINFRNWSLAKAQTFTGPFKILEERVYPERMSIEENRKVYEKIWWQFWRPRTELYQTIAPLRRVLVVGQTSKYHNFIFVPNGTIYNQKLIIFPTECYGHFACLQSAFHIHWIFTRGSTLKKDPVYTPSDCYDPFPFPNVDELLKTVGREFHEHRRQIMFARQEGLTTTYNRFHDPAESASDIARLRALHVEMDHAVAAAYGWPDLALDHNFHETAQGTRYTISDIARREVLTRLLALNHQRYAEEVAAGLHGKKSSTRQSAKVQREETHPVLNIETGQLGLFE